MTHHSQDDEHFLSPDLARTTLAAAHRSAFNALFFLRARTWLPVAPKPRPHADRLLISGFFNEALGIGQGGKLTAGALEAAGYDVFTEDLRPLHRGLLSRPPVDLPDDALVWLIHANPPEARIALFRHRYEDWSTRYRIGYWAWESSTAPRHWARDARWFHEIWVPSEHVATALSSSFADAGFPGEAHKLHIMPHPVPEAGPSPAHPGVRAITLFDPRSDFIRKNPYAAIEAWIWAFPNPRGEVSLIVKTLAIAADDPRIAELRTAAARRPDIHIVAETLSHDETLSLIAGCDILLSLHRGEGFGLPIAEAMAAGVCVIATGWSGNMQFMNPNNSLPVPYKLVPASRRYNGPGAQWADPDVAAAAEALHLVALDDRLRRRLGDQARIDIGRISQAWAPAQLFPREVRP